MVGMALATMVLSTADMNMPSMTPASTSGRRGIAAGGATVSVIGWSFTGRLSKNDAAERRARPSRSMLTPARTMAKEQARSGRDHAVVEIAGVECEDDVRIRQLQILEPVRKEMPPEK